MSLNARLRDWFYQTTRNLENFLGKLMLLISFLAFVAVVYVIGFFPRESTLDFMNDFFAFSLSLFLLVYFIRIFLHFPPRATWLLFLTELSLMGVLFLSVDLMVFDESIVLTHLSFLRFLETPYFIYILISVIFIIEVSKSSMSIYKIRLNPSLLYVGSFFFIIVLGTGMLLLPRATSENLSFIDALFTSTSAVCVTGLIVVDTATAFTPLGKMFILMLFQIGGLGVMLFTSFFGFFFQGGFSFHNQLFLKDFINEDKLGQIVKTLTKILLFTLIVEVIGAISIFHTLSEAHHGSVWSRISFSVFHSVSAFCNAGFSTLSDGLFTAGVRSNYLLISIIALLIVFGGIGFPVIINFYYYAKFKTQNLMRQLLSKDRKHFTPRLLNVNTRIVLSMTAVLLGIGTLSFMVFEWDGVLKEMSLGGKLATSFFGAVTPRTAGFNVVDLNALAVPTLLICFFLMWVGASPGSTGGGVKTSTFAIALLNIWSLVIGRNRVEVFNRELQSESILRAFAIIILSVLIIGASVFLISIFDPHLPLKAVAFECVSAFSTVGLSLGITSQLSSASKLVLILTMFIGRLGTLTILVAFVRKVSRWNYHYPTESVYIN